MCVCVCVCVCVWRAVDQNSSITVIFILTNIFSHPRII